MNRTSVIILVILAAYNSNNDKPDIPANTAGNIGDGNGKSISINTEKSYIKWRGTKLIGSAHEGTIKFRSGNLEFSKESLVGGTLIADMKTIYNTDIPLSDPVPRKNLTKHLNDDFETEKYPDSRFKIMLVKFMQSGNYLITGELTIKGMTQPITIEAKETRDGYTAQFHIDRFDWKVGESGTWLEKKVVDAEIELEVHLVL